MEFKEHSLGLYVHDAAASKDNILNETVNHYSFFLPYAEIGASFQQKPIWSIVVGGLFVCCFKYGCIWNIVSRW